MMSSVWSPGWTHLRPRCSLEVSLKRVLKHTSGLISGLQHYKPTLMLTTISHHTLPLGLMTTLSFLSATSLVLSVMLFWHKNLFWHAKHRRKNEVKEPYKWFARCLQMDCMCIYFTLLPTIFHSISCLPCSLCFSIRNLLAETWHLLG